MTDDDLPRLIRSILYAQEHRLLDDAAGQAALQATFFGVRDELVRRLIEEPVRKHQIAQAFAGPFALPQLAAGELILGLDQRGHQVRIPVQYLNAHSLTLAGSGSGKTTKAIVHAVQIAPHVRGLWLIDCRKAEWVKVRPLLRRIGVDLIVLPVRSMRLNPLQLPLGVEPAEWIVRVADMLVLVLELPPRASKLLQTYLHRLFRSFGIVDGSEAHPTLFDLLDAIKSDKTSNPPARQALIDSLDALLCALGPEVLAYRRGWPVHELAGMAINFVLGGVPEVGQNLILNTLLLAEFSSRIARGISNPKMDLFISLDEGQRVVSCRGGHNSALADVWPLVRGTGIGLEISIPTSHGLMPDALSCTATKYLGRCGSAADYELVGRAMGLSRDQLKWITHNTRPGRFIAQVGEGGWRHPLVLEVPPIQLPTEAGGNSECDQATLDVLPALPA